MPDSIMYQEDAYVVLESDREEEFFTPEELVTKLKGILEKEPEEIPRELLKFNSTEAQAKHLMENYCEFDVGEGKYLQWYAVRLEK